MKEHHLRGEYNECIGGRWWVEQERCEQGDEGRGGGGGGLHVKFGKCAVEE